MTGGPPQANGDESDAALLARTAEGDRAAFEQLATRYLPRLYRAALRLLDDPAEAEDVAQETMLRVWQRPLRFDATRGGFSPWVHRIAVNLAIDRRRVAARRPEVIPETIADPAHDPEASLVWRQRRAALASGIADLPPRQRAAVLLAYAEEQSGRVAAARLGTSARALEGLLHRARNLLRTKLLADDA
jgi:RNA polymerase sigma-70 factor (ECF subfamily)